MHGEVYNLATLTGIDNHIGKTTAELAFDKAVKEGRDCPLPQATRNDSIREYKGLLLVLYLFSTLRSNVASSAPHVCHRVTCTQFHRSRSVDFDDPNAALPVRTKSGAQRWVKWGLRNSECCALPQGGWADLHAISQGQWEPWQPMPVKLMLNSFTVRHYDGRDQAFILGSDQFLQGLLASAGTAMRVYIVTVQPLFTPVRFEHWPRVVGNGGLVQSPQGSLIQRGEFFRL